MFEKILSSIGIGSAKVNTVLLGPQIERGQEIKGEVHIFGGKVEQKIADIYIHIDAIFYKDDDTTDFRDINEPILEIKITDPVTVKPHEEKVVPFTFFLPYYTPITFRHQKVTIQTEIDLNFINHLEEHHDFVVTDPWIDDILKDFNDLGFKHNFKSGLCRYKNIADNNPTHCLQDFRLSNDTGMKIYFIGNAKDLDVYIITGNESVIHRWISRDKDLNEQLLKIHEVVNKEI